MFVQQQVVVVPLWVVVQQQGVVVQLCMVVWLWVFAQQGVVVRLEGRCPAVGSYSEAGSGGAVRSGDCGPEGGIEVTQAYQLIECL